MRFLGSMWAERVYGSRIYKNVKTKRLSVEGGESRPGRLDTPAARGYFKATGGSRKTFRDANCAHLSFSFALPVLRRRALSGRTKPTSGRPSRRALRVNLAITTEVRIAQDAMVVKDRFGAIGFFQGEISSAMSKAPPFAVVKDRAPACTARGKDAEGFLDYATRRSLRERRKNRRVPPLGMTPFFDVRRHQNRPCWRRGASLTRVRETRKPKHEIRYP